MTVELRAGPLTAVFLPEQGMLGASLRHGDVELLRRVDDLPAAAAAGKTAGIPFLHPWANRLDGVVYRAAGREVRLDPARQHLLRDGNGLPLHGVPWSALAWEVIHASRDRVSAQLLWNRDELLAVFPFPHRVELDASLDGDALTLETTLRPTADASVPVSFGFHPYFGIPDLPRARWRLETPALRRLLLDDRKIPTGAEEAFGPFDAELGARSFDDGFRLLTSSDATLALSGAGWRISVDFLAGYPVAQIYAPPQQDLVSIEPMTAATNALVSGRGLPIVPPRGQHRAAFRIRIEAPR